MASLGSLVVSLNANTSNFTKGMTKAQKTLTKVSTAAVAAGAAVAVLGAKKFIEFDDAMRAALATTQAMPPEFAAMTAEAKRLGATTTFTAAEVAKLMTTLGRAGFEPDDINEMTGAVLNLARATGTDAEQSAGILGSTIRQFNLDDEDAAHVADVLTMTANSTFNTVEQLGEAMKFAGPAAADLGVSLEDTAAAVGMLGNIGIQGTMAGTAIRRLAVKTGAEAQKMQRIFGFAFTDMAGESRPLLDNLEDLGKSLAKMSGPERMAALSDAFGILGVTAGSALGKSAQGSKELADALRDADGAAQRAADIMDAGLGGATERAKSAFDSLLITIGDQLSPALTVIAEASSTMAGAFESTSDVMVPLSVGIGVVIAAVLAYIAAAKAWAISQATVLALMGPSGWKVLAGAAIAVAATTAAITLNSGAADDARKANEELKASQEGVTKAADKMAGANQRAAQSLAEQDKGARVLASALQSMESPARRTAREMEEFQRAMRDSGKDQTIDMAPLLQAMRKSKSGFTDMLRTVNDELKILKGTATETSLELDRMAAAGVDEKSIKHLESKIAERTKLEEKKSATEAAAKAAKENAELLAAKKKEMQAQADAVIASVASPSEKIQAEVDRLKKLIAAGVLDKATAEQSMIKFQQGLAGTKQQQQLTPSMQRGSTEALTTILRQQQQGAKKSPEVEETKTTNKILRGMAAVLERQRERDILVQEAVT
jgi:TP901 family phage tail tape measure protein